MKSRSTARYYTGMVFVLGFISGLCIILQWNNLNIPFQKFPTSFKIVTLASLSLMSITTLVSILWWISLKHGRERFLDFHDSIIKLLNSPKVRFCIIFSTLLLSLVAGQFLLQSDSIEKLNLITLFAANQGFFIWIILVSLLSLGFIITNNGFRQFFNQRNVINPIALAISIFLFLVLLNESQLGFLRATGGNPAGNFRLAGFPILDYQVFFALILGLGGFFLIRWVVKSVEKKDKSSIVLVDILIILGLFMGSFLLSNSSPVVPNAFIDQPRPPNFTISPNLDAELYEGTAQNLLAMGKIRTYIGEGDYLSVGRRPLLTVYLAGLHQVVGLGYEDILPLQLLFFALVPVLIYIFTKTLHNRISGIVAAVLMIYRHQNGLVLADSVWGGANLHMMMSDFPTLIIVILFLILSIIWIRNFSENSLFPIVVGGVLGLGMLIRQEVLVLMPMVGIAALLGRKPRYKIILKQFLLLFMGTVLVITPWITRNWVNTGKVYLDKPGNRIEKIIRTFTLESDNSNNRSQEGTEFIDETNIYPIEPIPVESDDYQLSRIQLVGNHYANAFPQLFLYLPSNPLGLNIDYLQKLFDGELEKSYGGVLYSPYKYAKSLPYWWWGTWDGKVDSKSWIYLCISISFISLGIYRVWKKEHWIVFVPLLSIFGMISIYAVNQTSGGRWLQTVDWLSVMFLSIGLVEISIGALDNWRDKREVTHSILGSEILEGNRVSIPKNTLTAIIFLGIIILGSSPVIAEVIMPNHYPESTKELLMTSLLYDDNSALSHDDQGLLLNFVDHGGEVIYGRAVYPRYFPPDAELMTTNQRLFPSSTTFTIAGTALDFVVLPRLEPPISFPHGSDVLVFGCKEVSFPPGSGFTCLSCRPGGFDALAVIQLNENDQVVDVQWRDGEREDFSGCPLDWPQE